MEISPLKRLSVFLLLLGDPLVLLTVLRLGRVWRLDVGAWGVS
nr:MAG TPA: hypothetical protein [Caudoviricetes sp.]